MSIKNISPVYLPQIQDMAKNYYSPSLERKIKNNLGVVATVGSHPFFGKEKVIGFALYKTKGRKYIYVTDIDGDQHGIKEILGYMIGRMKIDIHVPGHVLVRQHLFVEVPIQRTDILNILKNWHMFHFEVSGDNVIAVFPSEANAGNKMNTFKQFMSQQNSQKQADNPDDEYGLFKNKPWKDQL